MHLHDSRTQFRIIHHSTEVVGKKQHLAVADVGQECYILAILAIAYGDIKARVRKLCLSVSFNPRFFKSSFHGVPKGGLEMQKSYVSPA